MIRLISHSKKQKTLILAIAVVTVNLFFFIKPAFSQIVPRSVVASSGYSFTGAGIIFNANIGELIVSKFVAGNNILTQGFIQPDDIATTVELINENDWEVIVFPNPVDGILNIHFPSNQTNPGSIRIKISDLLGREMELDKPVYTKDDWEYVLNLNSFVTGIYIIQITVPSEGIQKVVKIHKL